MTGPNKYVRKSAFREAIGPDVIYCPKCGDSDLQPPASPTLEPEQDGSLTCRTCATNFRLPPKEK